MSTLTTLQYAYLCDGSVTDHDAQLSASQFSAVSSNPAVAIIAAGTAVSAVAPGTTTITVTRNADGATATLDVTVEAADSGFTVRLGTPLLKS